MNDIIGFQHLDTNEEHRTDQNAEKLEQLIGG